MNVYLIRAAILASGAAGILGTLLGFHKFTAGSGVILVILGLLYAGTCNAREGS